ncbi:uncharacterized protein LOC114768218 isoform X2 [Denticeps clupeoides]|uniref:uncharacterized protein LOC114768218 isoform X2 n=1 Tax=Denticeps clupeoides TaxID=299321 RepID=UPI0010A43EBA|nr:uncharacterized protein LOC114768218 isoform X2 [Denticeps clupeoides]
MWTGAPQSPSLQHFGTKHQKLSSEQLIGFLRANSNTQHVAAGDGEGGRSSRAAPGGSAFQLEATLGATDFARPQPPKPPHAAEPVFRVKNSSGGSLVYSIMVATDTELWDAGDVFTEPGQVLCRELACPSTLQGNDGGPPGNSDPRRGVSVSERPDAPVPEFQINKFEEMAVVVTHVTSPSDFYIQRKESHLNRLSEIHDEGSDSFSKMNRLPDIGTYVMAWFPEHKLWCRGIVSRICGMNRQDGDDSPRNLRLMSSIEVEVVRIDYGDSARLSLWNITEMSSKVAAIPLQALQVSLASVSPVEGDEWSEEAVSWFKDKISNRTLYARLYPKETTVVVELFMEKGMIGGMRRGPALSLRLAQNGHAKHDHLRTYSQKRSDAQDRAKKQSSAWGKYVMSVFLKTGSDMYSIPVQKEYI